MGYSVTTGTIALRWVHDGYGDQAPTGTFRVYDGDTLIGYVLTRNKPGEGPDFWNRPLGYQGYVANRDCTLAPWAPDQDGAVRALLAAYRAETAAAS